MVETAEEVISKELDSGEKMLWAGRPRQGIVFRGFDFFFIPFSILWCGFAVFWEYNVVMLGHSVFMMIWGIPFVLVGIYVTVGRFWTDAMMRRHTYYGVTNRRVVIISRLWNCNTQTLSLEGLSDVSLTTRSNGGGDIRFGPLMAFHGWYGAANWPGFRSRVVPAFELASDAREVYQLIRNAQQHLKQDTPT